MNSNDQCEVCKSANCNFITRCGHKYHKSCLKRFWIIDSLCYKCKSEKITMNLLIEKYILGHDEDIPVNDAPKEILVEIFDSYLDNSIYELSTENLSNILKRLMELGWNLNSTKHPKCGPSFLYRACEANRFELVKLLLKNGANVDFGDFENQKHPLELACIKKHLEIANLLLDHGAQIDFGPERESLEFFYFYPYAFKSGNVQLIDRIICKKAEDDAEKYAELSVKERIVKLGAEIKNSLYVYDNADEGRYTMLHAACAAGSTEIFTELIEIGLDIHATVLGYSTIHFAVVGGNSDILNYLSNLDVKYSGNTISPLHLSICFDNLDIVKFLIELGHDVNAVDDKGQTPLHHAASLSNYKSLKYLLDLEASDIKVLDSNGSSPIDLFFKHLNFTDQPDQISLIVHPKIMNQSWFWVCKNYCHGYKLLDILIDNGVDVHLVDEKGRNGVFYAVQSCDDDLLAKLHELKVDINLKDCYGVTPLKLAQETDCEYCLNDLEGYGAV